MKFSLIPRNEDFFLLFEKASDNLVVGANLLQDFMDHYEHVEAKAQKIKDVEHQGDLLTHEIVEKLNRSFITPIDREDIHALASGLDDVLDSIEAVANRMMIFKITAPTEPLKRMTGILVRAVEEINRAVHSLRKLDHLMTFCIEIKNLETKADELSRHLLSELFKEEKDPITVIKWKEIYGRMEAAADECEDIAKIIEAIVVKNA
jgi:predicted phosphate transport protein (TIGR00153 family)